MAIIKNPLTLVKQEGGGQTQGEYFARVVDYDGTVLKMEWLNNGDTFEMPTPPTHSGLVFDGWSSSQAITNNKITIDNNNFIAGPMYYTQSGYNEIDIELSQSTGLDFVIGADANSIIDWGDSETTNVTTQSIQKHTYSNYGNYTVKYNGDFNGRYTFGDTTSGITKLCIKHIRCKKDVLVFNSYTSGQQLFSGCANLKTITFSSYSSIHSYNQYIVQPYSLQCVSLNTIIIPALPSNTSSSYIVLTYTFQTAIRLENLIIPFIGVERYESNYYLYDLKYLVMPNNLVRTYYDGSNVEFCIIPQSATTFNISANCQKLLIKSPLTIIPQLPLKTYLKEVVLPSTATELSESCFRACSSLNDIDISNITIFNSYSLGSDSPSTQKMRTHETIIFNANTSLIGANAFRGNFISTFDFTHCTSIPTLSNSNAFSSGSNGAILVPSSLYSQWIIETNWASLASRIVAV